VVLGAPISDFPDCLELNFIKTVRKSVKTLESLSDPFSYLSTLVQQTLNSCCILCTPFIWVDGPLIDSIKNGHMLLIDEISLAPDTVIERMNSVLEADRKLYVAEKAGSDSESLNSHKCFKFLATMNPSGDFGKKELSATFRNRILQIWVFFPEKKLELWLLLEVVLAQQCVRAESIGSIFNYLDQIQIRKQKLKSKSLTIRDLRTLVNYISKLTKYKGPVFSFFHGNQLIQNNRTDAQEGVQIKTDFSFLFNKKRYPGNINYKIKISIHNEKIS
jgi:midasin